MRLGRCDTSRHLEQALGHRLREAPRERDRPLAPVLDVADRAQERERGGPELGALALTNEQKDASTPGLVIDVALKVGRRADATATPSARCRG